MKQKNNNKRCRSTNWTESEKVRRDLFQKTLINNIEFMSPLYIFFIFQALLIQLIKSKINIIENKDVSKIINNRKKAAWRKILERYVRFYYCKTHVLSC